MRISDWSSDVCSSDLAAPAAGAAPSWARASNRRARACRRGGARGGRSCRHLGGVITLLLAEARAHRGEPVAHAAADEAEEERDEEDREEGGGDRNGVVGGKSVSVRVDLGGRRIRKKKKTK